MSANFLFPSAVFSGNSRYAADFQAVIDRSVAIASLPISQLNNDKAELEGESTALESLNGKFDALHNAITAIDDSLGSFGVSGLAGEPHAWPSVSLGAGAMEGNYSIEVVRLGSYSTAISADLGIAEPSEDGPRQRAARSRSKWAGWTTPSRRRMAA